MVSVPDIHGPQRIHPNDWWFLDSQRARMAVDPFWLEVTGIVRKDDHICLLGLGLCNFYVHQPDHKVKVPGYIHYIWLLTIAAKDRATKTSLSDVFFLQEQSTLSWEGTLAQRCKCSWSPWLLFSSKTPSKEPRPPCTALSRRGSNHSVGVTSPTAPWEKSLLKPRMTLQQRSCGSSVRDCVVSHKKLSTRLLFGLSFFILDINYGKISSQVPDI